MSREERPRTLYGSGEGTPRAEMDAAIKAIVIPCLRGLGFKGSPPNFRRERDGACDILTLQFGSAGGAFVVELGRVGLEGFDFHGRHIPPAKASTRYLQHRHRLGGPLPPEPSRDSWYVYCDQNAEMVAREVCEDLRREEVWDFVGGLEARV